MLSVRLICVGKLGEKFWKQACDEYVKRLGGFCKIEVVELPEQKLPQAPTPGQTANAQDLEARDILPENQAPGEAISSGTVDLAVSGTSRLAIVIGGSCGLAESVKRGARLRLSMSPMTFPHHLARVMVLEQLYRALNILEGGKYHK